MFSELKEAYIKVDKNANGALSLFRMRECDGYGLDRRTCGTTTTTAPLY